MFGGASRTSITSSKLVTYSLFMVQSLWDQCRGNPLLRLFHSLRERIEWLETSNMTSNERCNFN